MSPHPKRGNKPIACLYVNVNGASLVTQRLKRLPAMRETWVRSLGGEDPLEKEMATHCSILAWGIPWKEEPGGLYSPRGGKESDTTERLHFHFHVNVSKSKTKRYGYVSTYIKYLEQSKA